ncbi:MAG: NAD(P)H-hydrate epimerase [Chloroflexota bacterium]
MTVTKPKFGPEKYAAHTVIIQQGDEPDRFYIITRGVVEVIHRYPDGREVVLDTIKEGGFFGEIGLLKQIRRVATVRAQTDVEVMTMDRSSFKRWLDSSLVSREELDALVEERLGIIDGSVPLEDAATLADEIYNETLHDDIEGLPQLPAQSIAGMKNFSPGEIIIHEGDLAENFYIIAEGAVEVYFRAADESESVIARLESGNYFGEIGLLEGGRRTATVRAATAVTLIVFDRETFGRWLSHSPTSKHELRRMAYERRGSTKPLPLSGVPCLTTAQMREVDRAMTEDYGIELIQMMENAGRNLAHLARTRFLEGDPRGNTVVILAGSGGNGGGGLVCARRLHNWGASVHVFITKPDHHFRGIPAKQLEILRRMGVPVTIGSGMVLAGMTNIDLIIDAIIGYSLGGNPQGNAADFIRWANAQSAPILSLDTPSGLELTNGHIFEPAIRATATMTLALPKEGLRYETGRGIAGELYLADISVPPDLYSEPGIDMEVGFIFAKDDIVRL